LPLLPISQESSFSYGPDIRLRTDKWPGPYPAFSNIVRLIFCASTISLVTLNSRTFL
jgi:hypothetical protein